MLGTPTGIFNGTTEPLTHYFYPDETFGVSSLQTVSGKVDQVVRDAFTNGSPEDLQTVIQANGMQLQYLRISWNEYPNFEIRDLVVGVVVKSVASQDMTPQRLINAMGYVSWFKNFISRLSLSWSGYRMTFPPATHPPDLQYSWLAEFISNPYDLSSLTGTPPPPSVDEVRSQFITTGKVDNALGEFTRSLLDQGYVVTLSGYQVGVTFETVKTWQNRDRSWVTYRTHIQLSVQFVTEPALSGRTLIGPVLMAAILKGIALIIVAIGAAVGVAYFLYGLSHTETTYEKWGWELNPATGQYEWKIIEKGQKTAPPDWWGNVFIVVALGVVGYFAYKIFRGKEK